MAVFASFIALRRIGSGAIFTLLCVSSVCAATSDTECLLDWAESRVPSLLTPVHQPTQTLGTIRYRAYPSTGVYLGIDGAAVLAVGGSVGDKIVTLGATGDFLPTARAEGCGVVVGAKEFRSATPVRQFSIAELTQGALDYGYASAGLQPKYGVTSYRLEYLTLDGAGQSVAASALVNVPHKPAGVASPVLSYQHGTATKDAEAPSNHAIATEVSVQLASAGYIVLAPDYVGYGVSKGKPHPYLLSAPSAAAVIDLLSAAQYWRQTQSIRDNGQLVLVGYSEGAYVSMAAARQMQAENNPHQQKLVTAVLGSGPYHVGVTLDALLNQVRDKNALLGALINPGFLRYLGSSVQVTVRNELMNQLLGSDADVVFDPTVIDKFLADDTGSIEQMCNVHNWSPTKPFKLLHGRDDQLVSYRSSIATVSAMQSAGAGSQVSLTDCAAAPATHLGCIPDFWNFMNRELAFFAKDL